MAKLKVVEAVLKAVSALIASATSAIKVILYLGRIRKKEPDTATSVA